MSTLKSLPPRTTEHALPDYAELHCRTNFSFLVGASHPEELVERAYALGYRALAITDECSLAGVVRAHVHAKSLGFTVLIGSEIEVRDAQDAPFCRLVAIAQTREGYGHLSELITLARLRGQKGEYRCRCDDFAAPEDSFAHLQGLPQCIVILIPAREDSLDVLMRNLQWAQAVFGDRLYVAAEQLLRDGDTELMARTTLAAERVGVSIVAAGDVHMHVRSRRPLRDVMTAVKIGKPLHACGFALASNAEQHLRRRMQLASLYPAEWLHTTLAIVERCTFSLDELRYEYPDEIVPLGETAYTYLRRLTLEGAQRRWPEGVPNKVVTMIDHELALIHELRYEPYFLTVYDIVAFARRQGILCQGRGSAANSAVCYCLGVTEVDPSRMNMLFERFISRERNEPPDIDVDFEHQRREEVIQYIYDKYGTERAALSAALATYRTRSAIRDVGKALGFEEAVIDTFAKDQDWWNADTQVEHLTAQNLTHDAHRVRLWIELVDVLKGFPRHLSQHPGGFVIARGKLSRLVPIENAAMADRRVIQWDKDDLDALGLIKVDVLGLGMLSAIRRALEFIARRRGHPFRMQDVPAEDTSTYDMICAADTMGVFQIESRAQMAMLPRLQPRCYYDLVVEVAIVRPGPIQGGMVHPYLRRRQGLDAVTYPGPEVREALGRTLGVPIFQEQVMQLAVLAAGFSPGEADRLRRSMAEWRRKGGLMQFYDRIVNGMRERGYDVAFAEQIFKQIEGFGEYGFAESHAASFALLVYVSCWIKRHEPAAFLAALLNSQPLGFYTAYQLVRDAQRHGVEVLPVDVCISDWDCTFEEPENSSLPPAVRLGLRQVTGLSHAGGLRIEAARRERAFVDTQDLARRAALNRADLSALSQANALASLSGHRRQAVWEAVAHRPTSALLRAAPIDEPRVELNQETEGQSLVSDLRHLGLTLGRHPMALLRPQLAQRGIRTAAELRTCPDGRIVRAAGIVTVRQRPGTSKGVMFMTLEDETGVINLVVWPSLQEKQRREILGSRLLTAFGRWQNQQGVQHLIAGRVRDDTALLGALRIGARNFK